MLRALLAPFLVIALVLGACGGGDGADAKTEAGLKKAAEKAAKGLFGGDLHDTYDAYSKECREQASFAQFNSSMKLAEAFLEAFLEASFDDVKVKEVQVRNFEGDSGEVLLVLQSDKIKDISDFEEEWTAWAWEDGAWVQTDCSDMGSTDDGGGTSPSATQEVPQPGSGPAIGTPIEAGGSRYTVHSVVDPAPKGEFFEPKAGNRWVTIEVTQEALGKKVSGSSFDFSVQDKDGFIYDFTFGGKEPEFTMMDLGPGQRQRGFITFEVPEKAELVAIWVDADWPDPQTLLTDLTRK